MLQAYSTYALGVIVTIFAILHNDLFAGARDYDSDIALPAACSEIVYPAGSLHYKVGGTVDDKAVITVCQSAHTFKVAVPKEVPCLLPDGEGNFGCFDLSGTKPHALIGNAVDKHGGVIAPTDTNLRHRVVEHVCEGSAVFHGAPAEASCKQAKSMASWALALTVAGWVLAVVGLHRAVYQASFVLFTFAALALLVSWDAVMTMHAEQMEEIKINDGANPHIETEAEPVLPAIVISALSISMFVHVYGFYRKGEGYEPMKAQY